MIEFPSNYWDVGTFDIDRSERNIPVERLYLGGPNNSNGEINHERNIYDFNWHSRNMPYRINPQEIKDNLIVSEFIRDENVNHWMINDEHFEVDDYEPDDMGYFIIKDLHNIYVFLRYQGLNSNVDEEFNRVPTERDDEDIEGADPLRRTTVDVYNVTGIFDDSEIVEDFAFHRYILDKYGSYNHRLTIEDVYFIADTDIYT